MRSSAMSGHSSLQLMLRFALHSITRPLLQFFPFNSTHFWNGFLQIFILSSSVNVDQIWAHRFFSLLHLLTLTASQFSGVLNLQSTTTKEKEAKLCEAQLKNPPSGFCVRPTLLIRVITPTGFSVTVRALVDSGCSDTFIANELATLLLSNGAKTKYFWPRTIQMFSGFKQLHRSLGGIKLQSLENETVIVSPTSIVIDEVNPYFVEYTPVDLVIEKMASFGLPMIEKPLLNTMWSREDPNSQFRIDMLIGQDLMNEFNLMHPYQPTYHITYNLSIIRTKMGLTFSGYFDVDTFRKLKLSFKKEKKMKKVLCSKAESLKKKTFLFLDKIQVSKNLRLNINNYNLKYIHYFNFCCSLFLYIHHIVFFLIAILFSLLFQLLIIVSLGRHFKPIQNSYTAYLRLLLNFAEKIKWIYHFNLVYFCTLFFGCSIDLDSMNIYLRPFLYLTVSFGSHIKTVHALLDSGSSFSYISPQLAKELKMISDDEKKDETTSSKSFEIQVSDPGHSCEPIFMNVYCRSLPNARAPRMSSVFIKRLSRILQTPLQSSLDVSKIDLLIGSFHMSEHLWPESFPPKCYSLSPNLSAIETCFGYYLQGKQTNNNLLFICNWIHYTGRMTSC